VTELGVVQLAISILISLIDDGLDLVMAHLLTTLGGGGGGKIVGKGRYSFCIDRTILYRLHWPLSVTQPVASTLPPSLTHTYTCTHTLLRKELRVALAH
jgi:hypothetical protein